MIKVNKLNGMEEHKFILTFYMFISNIKILHLNKKYSLGRENFN